MQSVLYRINSADVIVFINQAWDSFALRNDAPDITVDNVLYRPLWDFIYGEAISQLYRDILAKVRAGNILRFKFSCDSPEEIRSMEMVVSGESDGGVQFQTYTLQTTERPAQEILDRKADRTDKLISICSWYKSINTESQGWTDLDEAISLLGLFNQTKMPELTHGMCEDCYRIVSEKLHKNKE